MKLGSVATDVLGVSGRDMLQSIIDGQQDPQELANLARGRLKSKIPQLQTALHGKVTEHHRFMLGTLMEHLAYLESTIARLSGRIEQLMRPFEEQIQRLTKIPGIERRTAQNILAEIGTDMGQFPSAAHLSSWAGMCPGNQESAGKRRSGRTTPGNRWLRSALVRAGWAATRAKKSYFHGQYRRLAGRRSKKRAVVAVAHSLLVVTYHVLKDGQSYSELGADYLANLDPRRQTRYFVNRLERLGYEVTLAQEKPAA